MKKKRGYIQEKYFKRDKLTGRRVRFKEDKLPKKSRK